MKVDKMVLCALFAALTAICAQIAIPLGAVPINMAMLPVFLAALVLGGKYGAFSQLVYVLIGAAGVPVFSLFRGGIGIILGPTGGYIAGYIAAAFIGGMLYERFNKPLEALLSALAVCYFLGTIWFMLITQNDLLAALSVCVLPFLPGDGVKIMLALWLNQRIKKHIKN